MVSAMLFLVALLMMLAAVLSVLRARRLDLSGAAVRVQI